MSWGSKLWAIWIATVIAAGCGSGGGGSGSGDDGGAGGLATESGNHAPSADAGPAQRVDVEDEVTLDGSDSTDPDGDELTFAWKIVGKPVGAEVQLSDDTAVRPTFQVPQDGSYLFELVVSDGQLSSEPSRVSVSTSGNRAPIADAGEDIAAKVGDEVSLDGTASMDPDGDRITYAWSFKSKPDDSEAELSDGMAVVPTFTLDVEGDYVIELVVSDGAAESEPAEVIVSTGNLAPRAEIAIKTDPIHVDESVTLDASDSHDANGDELSYSWAITSKPKGSQAELSRANRVEARLTPDVRGDYVVQLIVNDGSVDGAPVTALLTPENRPPVADAGADVSRGLGATVNLDGSASADPDHDTLSYSWRIKSAPEGSVAELAQTDTAAPSITLDLPGEYAVELTVSDGDADSEPDLVTLTADATAGPSITSFSPTSGPAGTLVTVVGSGFTADGGVVHVWVSTPDGEVEATIVSVTDTEIQFVLPPGATSGNFTVQLGDQKAVSASPLSVEPSATFELGVEPSTVSLSVGVSVAALVKLGSATGFADLAQLSLDNLPSGMTASFKPDKIRAGDWALLTLEAAADLASTQVELVIRASAEVDAESHSELGKLVVDVPNPTTAFVGRTVLDDPRETPLAGVTVSLLGKNGNAGSTNCQGKTTSDAAGNFAFTNLPAGCTATQLVRYDGLTVTAPEGEYAGVDIAHDLAPGVATQAPVLVHLPRIDNAPTVGVKQNAATDQVFTFPGIPDLELTVYAGTTLTMPDGSTPDPFPLIAVPVPVDRLPEEVPQVRPGFHFFIVAFQPANALASQPVAVSYPNQLAFPPGTAMPLLTLDPELGVMVQYGTGKVSDDGTKIVPDLDPKYPGRRFGIIHFDWHGPFSFLAPLWELLFPTEATGGCPGTCGSVDFATGIEHRQTSDIALGGSRGGIGIERLYRTGNTNVGPFGIGTSHNYHYQLNTPALTGATFNMITPNGTTVPFVRQADGSYLNKTQPAFAGAVFSTVQGGSQLRLLNGTKLGFQPFARMGGSMLTSISDPNGNVVSLTRNANAPFAITTVTDPVGRQLTLAYDASARVTSITDPLGRKVAYTYASGLLSSVTDVRGKITQYTYTAQGQLQTITDPRGVKVLELTYDANGRASSETLVGQGKTTFEYTVVNQSFPMSPVVENKVTDPSGRATVFRFNPRGYLLSTSDALGQTQTYEREGGTNYILQKEDGSAAVQYTYSPSGQLLSATDPAGATSKLKYESSFGLPTEAEDALGNHTKLVYDARGNLTQVTNALEHSGSFEYDASGLVTAVTGVDGQRSTLSYDGAGNLVSVTDPEGNVSRMGYDAASRLVEVTDAVGRRSRIRYNEANQVIETTDPAGLSTKFAYDDIGNLSSLTDARGAVTQYEYDTAGRLVKRTDPLLATEQFSYDSVGHLVSRVDRRGLESSFAYDTLDRLSTATYADATVNYRYDARGNLSGITDSQAGEYTFSYDERGLLTGMQGPGGSIAYAYDKLGRVTKESILGQPDTVFSYNASGQYTRIETQGAGVAFAYDAAERLTSQTRDNGVVTHFEYDAVGATIGVRHELDGSDIDLQTYEHDASGETTHAEGAAMGPLATAEITASYDLGNRIQSWGSKTFTHDADGNRLEAKDGANTETYAWDGRGRLKSITRPDGKVVKLSYDFAGNLARISSSEGDETLLNDASGNVVLRRTRAGSIQRLLSGLAMDHQVALIDSKDGVRYPLGTRPNSTVATVDGKGLVDGQYSYEPYGETSVVEAADADYPFLFTGRNRVTDGLYYYRARYYDPVTSRFVSEDPLGFGGGDTNLYGYVGGNPVSLFDPLGLTPQGGTAPVENYFAGDPNQGLVFVPMEADGMLDFMSDPAVVAQGWRDDSYFAILAHGDPNAHYAVSTGKKDLTVEQVANAILQSHAQFLAGQGGWDGKKPIKSIICYGSLGGNGSFNAQVAQRLAEALGHSVTIRGSTHLIGFSGNGYGSSATPLTVPGFGWTNTTAYPNSQAWRAR